MFLFVDVTQAKPHQRENLRKLLKNMPEASRRTVIRFQDNGLGAWQCLRALKNIYKTMEKDKWRGYPPRMMGTTQQALLSWMSESSWQPLVWELGQKQKLSASERRGLGKLRVGVKQQSWLLSCEGLG